MTNQLSVFYDSADWESFRSEASMRSVGVPSVPSVQWSNGQWLLAKSTSIAQRVSLREKVNHNLVAKIW